MPDLAEKHKRGKRKHGTYILAALARDQVHTCCIVSHFAAGAGTASTVPATQAAEPVLVEEEVCSLRSHVRG